MDLLAIKAAIATTARGISGVGGASSTVPETIPPSGNWFYLERPVTGTVSAGSWERIEFDVKGYHVFEQAAENDTRETAILPFVASYLTAFRSGITLGGLVTQCLITDWDTDVRVTFGGMAYDAIEFTFHVIIAQGATYTA